MKSIFRKSAIGLAILGLTGSAYAFNYNGAFAGVDALDLQPRTGDLDFISVFPGTGFGTTGTITTTAIHPSWTWGFRAYAGLKFCDHDDLTISWQRFRTSNNNDFANPDITSTAIPRFARPASFEGISSNINFNLDDVYGVYGHTLDVHAWSIRVAGGVEWSRLNSNLSVRATEATLPLPFIIAYNNNAQNTTRGAGPRAEIDMTYHMPYGFGLFAKTNAALLIASRQIEIDNSIVDSPVPGITFKTRRTVVPHVGLKLGLSLGHVFGYAGGEGLAANATLLMLEAGWQVDSYLHAIERPEGFENLAFGAFPVSNIGTKISNFSTQGLFLGLKISTGWI